MKIYAEQQTCSIAQRLGWFVPFKAPYVLAGIESHSMSLSFRILENDAGNSIHMGMLSTTGMIG